ncbi:MAG: MerR family DNA-binding transcriptional regulator [Acidimicrobiales bacterium]|nr:MerR family DNA-binding transcriptional regulator [Acidimicrobiales bacterium]
MPIGMFSRASSLSIKALRAYHEQALLVPASVDPRTGYRAYTVAQLADAAIIVRLRALDVEDPADYRTELAWPIRPPS